MKLLQALVDLLARLLKGIVYDWILALIDVIRRLLLLFKEEFTRPKPPHSSTNATNTGCGTVDNPAFHRPDPVIYSQKYLLSLGLAVTWDNPDISLFRNGVQVSEGDLLPNTQYEIRATIWNNSYDAPIVGLPIHFSFLSFGVTTIQTPIGSVVVDLGVKGGVQHPAIATMLWTTPPAGHYCIIVDFEWVDDANPNNNIGQNNVNVVAATSPAAFSFTIRNQEPRARSYRMEADTYTLPQPTDCSDASARSRDKTARWKEVQALHSRAAHPVPAGWTVEFTPPALTLLPGHEADVAVTVTPPAAFTGRQPFNVHAVMDNGVFAGGVTVYVTKA